MNPQFKKGILNLCTLALLQKRDMYGYELVQEISLQILISEGAVYPILRRLATEGFLTTYMKESAEGPARKYYRLTAEGVNELEKLKEEWQTLSKAVQTFI